MKHSLPILVLSTVTLTACGLVEVTYEEQNVQQEPVVDNQPVRETNNVTYTGTVQPAGISVYQQGSHRLVLPGGKFVLLESDDIDLNGYVDEEVQIFGALRPTVEAGGMIMRVERIELVVTEVDEIVEELPLAPEGEEPPAEEPIEEPVEEAPIEESPTDAEEAEELTDEKEIEAIEEIEESNEEEPLPSTDEEVAEEDIEVIEEVEEDVVEEETSEEPSAELLERIELMERQDYSAANWTQEYCTSHIAFCAPVHRNWWFKSFGATSSTLWHVELSPEPIESLGQGPIVVELIAGSIGDSDGTVEVVDGSAIGYREWTFGRHFRISAASTLEAPVRYITENISDYAN